MGNEAPHDVEGTKMCFNPAKTWYNGWFSNSNGQAEVFVNRSPYDGDLVGVDAATKNTYRGGVSHAVVKVNADHSESVDDLFIMYNSKNGINSEVVGFGNKVVITQQADDYSQSWHVGSLDYREMHRKPNWKNGKALIIKNCGAESLNDSVRVLIYLEGTHSLSCDDDRYVDNENQHSNSGNRVKFRTNSKCIANTNNKLRTVKCQNAKNQKWTLDSNGHIRNRLNSNKCIKRNGNTLTVGNCANNSKFEYTTNGKLKSKSNSYSNKCISRDTSGNQLILRNCEKATTWDQIFL